MGDLCVHVLRQRWVHKTAADTTVSARQVWIKSGRRHKEGSIALSRTVLVPLAIVLHTLRAASLGAYTNALGDHVLRCCVKHLRPSLCQLADQADLPLVFVHHSNQGNHRCKSSL